MDPYTNVPEQHIFHFRDGDKAHNLKDLRDTIAQMGEDEFSHHVDEFNNDFANWIEFVYKDESLANDVRQVSSKSSIVDVLDAEIGVFDDLNTPKNAPPQAVQEAPLKLAQDSHKFIVKEFVYGFIFGLIVGLVLMGVLSLTGVM